jgi:hypothetical protein
VLMRWNAVATPSDPWQAPADCPSQKRQTSRNFIAIRVWQAYD